MTPFNHRTWVVLKIGIDHHWSLSIFSFKECHLSDHCFNHNMIVLSVTVNPCRIEINCLWVGQIASRELLHLIKKLSPVSFKSSENDGAERNLTSYLHDVWSFCDSGSITADRSLKSITLKNVKFPQIGQVRSQTVSAAPASWRALLEP